MEGLRGVTPVYKVERVSPLVELERAKRQHTRARSPRRAVPCGAVRCGACACACACACARVRRRVRCGRDFLYLFENRNALILIATVGLWSLYFWLLKRADSFMVTVTTGPSW